MSFSELALAGIREPIPASSIRPADAKATSGVAGPGGGQSAPSASPRFVGVFVEAWGHIDECNGTSQIQKFEVRPLFD